MGYRLTVAFFISLVFISLGVLGLSAVGLYYIENTQDIVKNSVKNSTITPTVTNVAKSSSVICIVASILFVVYILYEMNKLKNYYRTSTKGGSRPVGYW